MDRGAWWATVHRVMKSQIQLSDFTFTFHFHALEKEMTTHSSILAWRIPGMGVPGGLLSLGWHRVRHDWRNLAAAAEKVELSYIAVEKVKWYSCCEKVYQLLKKLNTELPWPSNSIPAYILKIENRDSNRYLYVNAHCSFITIPERQKQPKCPSSDEWINKY